MNCGVLDQFDPLLVETLEQKQIDQILKDINQPDGCPLIDIFEETADPKIAEIENLVY